MKSFRSRLADPTTLEQNNYYLSENEKYKIDKMRASNLFNKAKQLFDNIKNKTLNINKYKDSAIIKAVKNEIMRDAEKILASRYMPAKEPTEFDARITNTVCLALTYARPNWTELQLSFRLMLIASIDHHHKMMKLKEAKNTLHALVHIGFQKNWQEAGFSGKQVLISLFNIVDKHIDESIEQLHANVLWGISRLNMDFDDIQPVSVKIINKILANCDLKESIPLPSYNDFAINQISAFIGNYNENFPLSWANGINVLTECCKKRAVTIALDRPTSSSLQAKIMPYIKKHAASPCVEEKEMVGGHFDAYFPYEHVIVEFDGESHTDSFGNLNASTQHRQRLASKKENLVVRITSKAWNSAPDKDEFMIQFLINAGIPVRKVTQINSSTQTISQTLQLNAADEIKIENLPSISITVQNIHAIPSLTYNVQNPNALPINWTPVRAGSLKRNFDAMQGSINSESNDSDEPSSKYQRDSSSSPSF